MKVSPLRGKFCPCACTLEAFLIALVVVHLAGAARPGAEERFARVASGQLQVETQMPAPTNAAPTKATPATIAPAIAVPAKAPPAQFFPAKATPATVAAAKAAPATAAPATNVPGKPPPPKAAPAIAAPYATLPATAAQTTAAQSAPAKAAPATAAAAKAAPAATVPATAAAATPQTMAAAAMPVQNGTLNNSMDSRKGVLTSEDKVELDEFKVYSEKLSVFMAEDHDNMRKGLEEWLNLKQETLLNGQNGSVEMGPETKRTGETSESVSFTINIRREGDEMYVNYTKRKEAKGSTEDLKDLDEVRVWGLSGKEEESTEGVGSKWQMQKHAVAEMFFGYPVALVLTSFLMFSMYVLYLLNHTDPQIRHSSYRIVSLSIAIFSAVMLEQAQSTALLHGLFQFLVGNYLMEKMENVLLLIICSIWYVSMSHLCFNRRGSKVELKAVHGVFMHLGVFVAIELFEHILNYMVPEKLKVENGISRGVYDRGTALQLCLLSIVPVVVLKAMSMFMETKRHSWAHESGMHSAAGNSSAEPSEAHGQGSTSGGHHGHAENSGGEEEEEEEWLEVAEECEVEFSGLLFGFIASQAAIYFLTGEIDSPECYGFICHAYFLQILSMITCAIFVSMLFIGFTLIHANFGTADHPNLRKVLDFLEVHVGFFACWNWLSVVDVVVFYYFKRVSLADEANGVPTSFTEAETVIKASIAFMMSPLLIIVIIGVDTLGDLGHIQDFTASNIIAQTGLFTGLVWEKSLGSALGNLSDHFFHAESKSSSLLHFINNLWSSLLYFAVVCSIYPAWKWYILPVAVQPPPEREKAFTPRSSLSRLVGRSSMSLANRASVRGA